MTVNTVIHKRIEPPRMDTYTKISDWVIACDLYKEQERSENLRLAEFLGEKTKDRGIKKPAPSN